VGKEQQEINLLEIWQVIVEQKRVVFITWMLCVGLGLAYVLLVTPVYKAEVFMLPPSQSDIQPLNISVLAFPDRSDRSDRSDFLEYDSESVYRLFVQTLKSRAVRRNFYEENKVAEKLGLGSDSDPDIFFENRFHQKLKIEQNVKKKGEEGFVTLSFEGDDPVLVAGLANAFVTKVANTVTERLVSELDTRVASLRSGVEASIQGKKSLAKVRRDDQVVALQEAYRISQALSKEDQQVRLRALSGGVTVNTEEFPKFMLSPNALIAQVQVLKGRKDNDPFIEGLRDLEERLITLESVKISMENISVVSVDQKAWVAKGPVKPKKLLALLLANLSGLLLGIIVAILSTHVMKINQRKR